MLSIAYLQCRYTMHVMQYATSEVSTGFILQGVTLEIENKMNRLFSYFIFLFRLN